jgi:hypothetical protein
LFERDIFDLYLPEFDKPWVIHLKEICCCSTNHCTWRPNIVYKNRSMRRYRGATLNGAEERGKGEKRAPPELSNSTLYDVGSPGF